MEVVSLVGHLRMFTNANAYSNGEWEASKSMASPLHVAERLFIQLCPQLCREEQLDEAQRSKHLLALFNLLHSRFGSDAIDSAFKRQSSSWHRQIKPDQHH